MLNIPRAPRVPGIDASSVAVELPEPGPPPSSMPTSPPPPTFSELRQLSKRPSPVPPPQRDDSRRRDSRSYTLPGPTAVPRLVVDATDLSWFEINEETRALVPYIDGISTILDIAEARGIPAREAQLRIADLRARGVVDL